jgi:hypothetical protein
MVAQKASLPASVGTVVGPLAYTDFAAPGVIDVAMKGAIYLFETAAKNAGNALNETCIVVGGRYDADSYDTYYRLDFFVQNTTTHMDILRNHRYVCNITEVRGRGYPTVDDAYRAKPSNMEVDIIVWDEGSIREIIFDGEYMLGVSENPFELTGDEHTLTSGENILYVATDYPTGFTYTVWENRAGTIPVSWITNVSTTNKGGNISEMRLIMSANPGSAPRTAYIHITAGRLTYIVEVIQHINVPNTITVTPDEMILPYVVMKYAKNGLYVNCRKPDGREAPNQRWTLTVPPSDTSWLKLSTDPSTLFVNAQNSISGRGSQALYVIVTPNGENDKRHAGIYLGDDVTDVVLAVTQMGTPLPITDNGGGGTLPVGTFSYVGAFWKANETGERIIRIDMGSNIGNHGEWTAQLMYLDDNWGPNDGVALSLLRLPGAPGADPNIYTANPGNAEDYQVEGNSPAVSYAIVKGCATFRVGLKSKYTPTAQHPARYAVILFSYNDNKKYQKIFLRQGEEPDYLFSPSDPIYGGWTNSTRPYARKWSPYNVTGASLNVPIPAVNGGTFVDYPSQAGAFFQWSSWTGRPAAVRTPWDPYTSGSPASPWNSIQPDYWSNLAGTQEVSPAGYHRPSDGVINAYESGANINVSEVRQSLFHSPSGVVNYNSSVANSLFGYCADGFFDRRPIENTPSKDKAVVALGTRNLACVGRLYFNPMPASTHYNASLFFPTTGTRDRLSGILVTLGSDSSYWSASADDATNAIALRIYDNSSLAWKVDKATGGSIRPVKNP